MYVEFWLGVEGLGLRVKRGRLDSKVCYQFSQHPFCRRPVLGSGPKSGRLLT